MVAALEVDRNLQLRNEQDVASVDRREVDQRMATGKSSLAPLVSWMTREKAPAGTVIVTHGSSPAGMVTEDGCRPSGCHYRSRVTGRLPL